MKLISKSVSNGMKFNYIYRNKYSFIEKPIYYGKDPIKPPARGSPTYAQLGQGASGRHSALTTRCRTAITSGPRSACGAGQTLRAAQPAASPLPARVRASSGSRSRDMGGQGEGGGGRAGPVARRGAATTHLFDLVPPLSHGGIGGLSPHGAHGLLERALGQPGGGRLLPAAGVLQKFLLVLADVSADLLGQLLQRLLGLAQGPFVVRADPFQAARPARLLRHRRAGTGLRRGAGLETGRRRLQGGRVEEDAAEQLGGVGQEEDGPEAEGDEGAEHQQQHELLRQSERAGARRLPAPAARAAARRTAQCARPRRATKERQQAGGGHGPPAVSARPAVSGAERRDATRPDRTGRLRAAAADRKFPERPTTTFPLPAGSALGV